MLIIVILKGKADNKNVNFSTQFCLGGTSNRFSATQSREVSLNGNVYDSIDEYEVLNIYKFTMVKINIK